MVYDRSLTYGAVKYAPGNWKLVKPGERYIDALFRHLILHIKGEAIDKETGVPHLAVVAVDALFALWHHKRQHPKEYEDYQAACNNLLNKLQHQKDVEKRDCEVKDMRNHNATGVV